MRHITHRPYDSMAQRVYIPWWSEDAAPAGDREHPALSRKRRAGPRPVRCSGEGTKILRKTVEGEPEAPPLVREWQSHTERLRTQTLGSLQAALRPTALGKGTVFPMVL